MRDDRNQAQRAADLREPLGLDVLHKRQDGNLVTIHHPFTSTLFGSATVNSVGQATLSATFVCNATALCGHTIAITYEGDANYGRSTGQIGVVGEPVSGPAGGIVDR